MESARERTFLKERGEAKDQIAKKESLEKLKFAQNEKIQRQQWSPQAAKKQIEIKNAEFLANVPRPAREKAIKSSDYENQQRENFLHDVENWSDQKKEEQVNVPIPPVPHKK